MAGLISKLLGNLSPDDVLYLSKRALDGDSGALKALKNAEGLDEQRRRGYYNQGVHNGLQ